jgi:hypothetical protein
MSRNESCCDTMYFQPSCHTCFHLIIIFRTVATKIFSVLEMEEFPPHNHNQCNTGYTIIHHALFLTDPHTEHYLPEHCMGTNGTTPNSSATFPNTTVPSTTFLSTPASSTHISVGKKLSVSYVTINGCNSNYKTEWWSLCRSLDCRRIRRWKV